MAYDDKGMAVGGTGHDAATMAAALISAGQVKTVDEAVAAFDRLHAATFDSYMRTLGVASVAEVFVVHAEAAAKSDADDAGSVEFKYGEFAGRTIADVYNQDGADALHRALAGIKSPWMRTRVETYLASK